MYNISMSMDMAPHLNKDTLNGTGNESTIKQICEARLTRIWELRTGKPDSTIVTRHDLHRRQAGEDHKQHTP
jgi:hypothetical protein